MSPRRKRTQRASPLPARKTTRRWRVPPPLVHGPEPLECASVLDEIAGPAGVLLWQTLRDVMLWSETPPAERDRLFVPEALTARRGVLAAVDLPADLVAPLVTLAALLGHSRATEQEVSEACRAVAAWAEEAGQFATALAYTQAVALVQPHAAGVAFSVGVLARRRAEHARAETWFRRAVMLARQSGDWVSYCLAFTGLGNLYLQRGNHPIARKLHMRARRAARRHRLRALEAYALHDLFVIATSCDQPSEAESFAQAALEAYSPGHPRLSALAHDMAYFWMERGHFARALPVFQAVLPHMQRAAEQVRVLADVARAAAGSGRTEVFEEAWDQATPLLHQPAAMEGTAQALLDLARGAGMLGQWERAHDAAVRAVEVATTRNQGKVRLEAEAVLESVRRGARVHLPEAVAWADGTGDALAANLVESLSPTGS